MLMVDMYTIKAEVEHYYRVHCGGFTESVVGGVHGPLWGAYRVRCGGIMGRMAHREDL